MNLNVGPGSHNRDTKKAVEHLEASKNLTQECKCIVHRINENTGTLISKTRYNRQGNGIQSMCSQGKTLIDALKHKFWRAVSLILLTSLKDGAIKNKEYNALINIEFIKKYNINNKIIAIFNNDILTEFEKSINPESNNMLLYLKSSKFLEDNLKISSLGFYEIYFENEEKALLEYNKLKEDLEELTKIEKFSELGEVLENLITNDLDNDWYIKESSNNDIFYNVTDVPYNWSKMNDIWIIQEDKYIKSGLRGPFHNTKIKGVSTTGRMVKFLVETDPEESIKDLNKYIKDNRKAGEAADHIIPLALGGKNTRCNIMCIDEKENLLKKDSLTFEAYSLMVKDIKSLGQMINGDSLQTVMHYNKIIGIDQEKFKRNVKSFELELKEVMLKRQSTFHARSIENKLKFLQRARPELNTDQSMKFIERFERHWNKK